MSSNSQRKTHNSIAKGFWASERSGHTIYLQFSCMILFGLSIFALIATIYFAPPVLTHWQNMNVEIPRDILEEISSKLGALSQSGTLMDHWTTNMTLARTWEHLELNKNVSTDSTSSSNTITTSGGGTNSDRIGISVFGLLLNSLDADISNLGNLLTSIPQSTYSHFTKTKVGVLTLLIVSILLNFLFIFFPPWQVKAYLREGFHTDEKQASIAAALKQTTSIARAFAAAPYQVSRYNEIPTREGTFPEMQTPSNVRNIEHSLNPSPWNPTLETSTDLPPPVTASTHKMKRRDTVSSITRSLTRKMSGSLKRTNSEIELRPIVRITHPLETVMVHQGLNKFESTNSRRLPLRAKVEPGMLCEKSREILKIIEEHNKSDLEDIKSTSILKEL